MAEPPKKPPHDRCEGQKPPDKWELEIVEDLVRDHPLLTPADALHRVRDCPSGASVTLRSRNEYARMRLFTTPNREAGFALDGDNIVSMFKHPDAPHQRVWHSMLDLATSQGARRLDAFDTELPQIYSRAGFRAVARLPWDDAYAPPGWDYAANAGFNGGRPDVVFMVHDPAGAAPYRAGDGKRVASYDEGVQAQRDALAVDQQRPNVLQRVRGFIRGFLADTRCSLSSINKPFQ